MHVTETFFVGSRPAFLRPDEVSEISRALSVARAGRGPAAFSAETRTESVHSVEGLSTVAAMRLYEPVGRDEVTALPESVLSVLETASRRLLPVIRHVLPSVRDIGSWTFVSYTRGQYITPHIDLPDNDLDPLHPKVAGLSVCLSDPDDYAGGEFFVETVADPDQWLTGSDGPRMRPDCDFSSQWYREQPRSRWLARPRRGDALLYGSRLTHGTEPVRSGRVDKIIGFLFS
jgi:hypothetical protein